MFVFFQATGSWDYSVRVWTVGNNSGCRQLANRVLQENCDSDPQDQSCLLNCLTGHTGNIHTVAFSKAGMLV